jgi:hypothetical protein
MEERPIDKLTVSYLVTKLSDVMESGGFLQLSQGPSRNASRSRGIDCGLDDPVFNPAKERD